VTTLLQASREWAKRPADESFGSLAALDLAARTSRERSTPLVIATDAITPVITDDGRVTVRGYNGLTHWAFGQLARIAGAPAEYLRSLPANIVVDAVTHGLKNPTNNRDEDTRLLVDRYEHDTIRAMTSTSYTRIFNADITGRLLRLADQSPEWQPAPEAADGKRGLYLGDQDMFAFLVDNGRRVFEKSAGGGLSRGFFTWNSEVGASAFGICTFLYDYVCGNHMIWGAKAVRELRLRHVGDVDQRALRSFDATVTAYADSSASDEEALIEKSRSFRIAGTKDEVLDKVFSLRVPALSRKVLALAYSAAEQHESWYGDPRSAWGLASGLTETSQTKAFANERDDIDRAAGKVLDLAFGV